MKRRISGVTLIELLVVMTIVGILMAIAVPSYRYVTNGNRMAAEINGLLGDLQYARSEAIREGQPVTVCTSVNSTSAAPTCAGTAVSTWQGGWIVFSDANSNQTVDAGDAVLRVQRPFTGTDTFNSDNTSKASAFTFSREGFATKPGVAAWLSLHDATNNSSWTRCLFATITGGLATKTYNVAYNGVTCI